MEIAKIEGWFLEQLSVLPFVESGSTQGEGMDWRCVAVMSTMGVIRVGGPSHYGLHFFIIHRKDAKYAEVLKGKRIPLLSCSFTLGIFFLPPPVMF
jgi:hypothetical protein